MIFNWNEEKNAHIKRTRNVSFEQVVIAIENGDVLDVLEHPRKKYRNQIIIVIELDGYAYAVPTVKGKQEYFLKTIFPSRKLTEKYMGIGGGSK